MARDRAALGVIFRLSRRIKSAIPGTFLSMTAWVASGDLKVLEDIVEGLQSAPRALVGILAGNNVGKRMVRVAPDPA